jgi:hypothetical protein
MNVKNSEVFMTKRCLIWLLEVVDRRFDQDLKAKTPLRLNVAADRKLTIWGCS